ncbi:uncharacterized protein LOC100114335 isoform X1 [Nasonia vitripennis]|uniref:Uncharacterized protein n=1 Tax=Nasonia vitripennis TaxID=7425 RepID=A0A7M7QS27_NASVI|nr:uncharacterized protein LOC100114335 isoform X1 [Nasonia vitripennis]
MDLAVMEATDISPLLRSCPTEFSRATPTLPTEDTSVVTTRLLRSIPHLCVLELTVMVLVWDMPVSVWDTDTTDTWDTTSGNPELNRRDDGDIAVTRRRLFVLLMIRLFLTIFKSECNSIFFLLLTMMIRLYGLVP